MSRRDQRELAHRLVVLVSHLLKWQMQPSRRSSSWSATINDQRRRIEQRLHASPSLRAALDEVVTNIYPYAVKMAARETGIANSAFPAECPFTSIQIRSDSFLPE